MAKRAPPARKTPAAKAQRESTPDLAILHPEQAITLRDRTVVVREYGYIEGLRLQAGVRLFLAALYAKFDNAGAPPSGFEVRELFADHSITVQWLIAQAITPYPESNDALEAFAHEIAANATWVAKLNDIEGDALLTVWWGVNAGFFTRRLREMRMAAIHAASQSPTPGSTPP